VIGFGMTSIYTGKFSGKGLIAGQDPGLVTVGGAPGSRRVLLTDSASRRLVSRGASNAAGQYEFYGIDPDRHYTVEAVDHLGVYNAVIRDRIRPVVPDP